MMFEIAETLAQAVKQWKRTNDLLERLVVVAEVWARQP